MGDPPARRPPRPAVPQLSLDEREALRHYGTMAARYDAFIERELPAMKADVDETKSAAMAASGMAKEARDIARLALGAVNSLRDDVNKLLAATVPGSMQLPPPPKMPSAHEIAEELAEELRTNPGVEPRRSDSERLRKMMEQHETEKKAKQLDALTEDEKKDRQAKKDAKRNALYGVAGAVAAAAIIALGGMLYAALQREAALELRLEGKSITPVPPPSPNAVPAPPPPVAPAAAGSTMPEASAHRR